MLFAVMFEDDPVRAAEIRSRVMPAHLAFLERNAAAIVAAGPLLEGAARTPAGGMWLVEADSRDRAEALTREDPFYSAGLRRSIRILEWRRVFADGRRVA